MKVDASLQPVLDRVIRLSQYAWRFRYPGEADDPSPEEVRQSLDAAREVWDTVLSRLPAELRSSRTPPPHQRLGTSD